jgi:hypothetical protein
MKMANLVLVVTARSAIQRWRQSNTYTNEAVIIALHLHQNTQGFGGFISLGHQAFIPSISLLIPTTGQTLH